MAYGLSTSRSLFLSFALLFSLWLLVFWQGIHTAVEIWLISDIFNHCLFVLPGAFYLIYLKRKELDFSALQPAYFAYLCCLGWLLVYAFGLAGDVKLFMHIATFSFLPCLIWAVLGHRESKKILFPLLFMLFCIPIGEELVPMLQEITADLSVMMLKWTSIPIYRSGLYIEIPQGRFLVAEACSGISFFIASIVIGSLYSYLNMQSGLRRVAFMSISALVPIVANAVRVFGIIVIGYLSNMEHAVGADHLIYGWFFFLFVIICLLGIGELFREKIPAKAVDTSAADTSSVAANQIKAVHAPTLALTLVMMLAAFGWFQLISQAKVPLDTPTSINRQVLVEQFKYSEDADQVWQPSFKQASDREFGHIMLNDTSFSIFIAWYPLGKGELITSLNRLYNQRSWTLESSTELTHSDAQGATMQMLVSPSDARLLTHWYVIDEKIFFDERVAKLYEIYRIMLGNHRGSGLIALSVPITADNKEEERVYYGKLIANNIEGLSLSLK